MLESLTSITVDGARLHLADGVITDPRAIFQARLTCLSAGVPS